MTRSHVPTYLGLSGKPLGFGISGILTFAAVLVGYDQGVMSGIISNTDWLSTFPLLNGNSTLLGLTVAIYDLGCLLGALLCMLFGDKLGRKRSCFLGGTLVVLGVLIQVTTFQNKPSVAVQGTLAQFILGRVITGTGNGMNMASIPVLQSELSHADRGTLVCLEMGLIASGTMLAYWVNYGVRLSPGSFAWRFPIVFQLVLCGVYMGGLVFLPESPRWLCKVGREDEATRVMAAVNGETETADRTRADVRAIVDSIELESALGNGNRFCFRELFSGGPAQHGRRVVLGVASQFFQQIGGCNAAIYYMPILLQSSLHKSHDASLLLGGVNMIVYFIFAFVSVPLVDRLGRRFFLIMGSAGQGLSMVIAFACLIPGTTAAANGAVFGLFLYIAFFGASYLTVPWLYTAEVNTLRIRAEASAVANMVNWSTNFLVVMVTPIMIDRIGWGTYLFFAAMNLLFVPFLCLYYPETAGRSLEEVDLIFAKGYYENMSYVRAARELPKLDIEDIKRLAAHYGLAAEPENAGVGNGSGVTVLCREKKESEC